MSGPTGEVYRIAWLPGTDLLHGTCHCGAEHTAQDPVLMWEWMLAHPEGHLPPAHEANSANTTYVTDTTDTASTKDTANTAGTADTADTAHADSTNTDTKHGSDA